MRHWFAKDLDFWFVVGCYIATGTLEVDTKAYKSYDVRIFYNDKKDLNHMLLVLKKNKYKYGYTYNERKLRFANRVMYWFLLKNFGVGRNKKIIPDRVLELPREQLFMFYRGFVCTSHLAHTNVNLIKPICEIFHTLFGKILKVKYGENSYQLGTFGGGKKMENNKLSNEKTLGTNPCYKCLNRIVGCHSTCKLYQDYTQKRIDENRQSKSRAFEEGYYYHTIKGGFFKK